MRYSIPTYEYCCTSTMGSLHGSIIYSNKNPIVQATNEPCGFVFKKHVPSIHAEMNVIYRARFVLEKINSPVLVVVRYNRNGELVNSYPCNLCIELIKKFGIVKVIYSDDNGNICECRTKNLISNHNSRGIRKCFSILNSDQLKCFW